jgi:hypothetical protein
MIGDGTVEFFEVFLRGLAQLPGVIQGTEELLGAQTGEQKKAAAVEIVGAAINLADAVSTQKIADAERFTAGLNQIVDGVVACLNASLWAKR